MLLSRHSRLAFSLCLLVVGTCCPWGVQALAGDPLREVDVLFNNNGIEVNNLSFQGECVPVSTSTLPSAAAPLDPRSPWLEHRLLFDSASRTWTLKALYDSREGSPSLGGFAVWCPECLPHSSPLLGAWSSSGSRLTGSPVSQRGPFAVLSCAPGTAWGARPSAAARRSLLQAAGGQSPTAESPDCSLTVNGTAWTFDSCKTPSSSGGTFTAYASVEARGTGSLLRLAFRARLEDSGWAALGLPETPFTMLGSRAAIAQTNASSVTGASLDGYELPTYNSNDVEATRGRFSLLQPAAQVTSGILSAVFGVAMNQTVEELVARPFYFIYAIGPLDSNGLVLSHVRYPYGGDSLTLVAPQPAASPAAAPAPGAAPPVPQRSLAPAPAPSAEISPGAPASPDALASPDAAAPSPAPDALASPDAAAPSPAPDALASPDAAAPSPAPDALAFPNAAAPSPAPAADCSLTLPGGASEAFAGCAPLSGVGTNARLYWTALPAQGASAVRFGLSMDGGAGSWLGLGFPTQPSAMIGASVAVLQSCADCQEGAQILPYYLGGYTPSAVVQVSNFALLNSTASTLPDGSFVAAFTVPDPAAAGPARRRSLLQTGAAGSLGAVPLIFASGRVSPGGGLVQHTSLGSTTVNLTSANSNLAVASSGESRSLVHAHAALMTVGWGVLLPLGAVVARGFRMTGTWWFAAHLVLQILGVLAGFAGIGIGYNMAGWHTTIPTVQVHRNIGTAAAACVGVQLLTAFVRPAKAPTKLRKTWEMWHHWLGRAGVVLAIVNIYYGYLHVANLGVWPYAVYSAVLGCVVLLGLAREPAVWRAAGDGARPDDRGPGYDGGGAPHGALAETPAGAGPSAGGVDKVGVKRDSSGSEPGFAARA